MVQQFKCPGCGGVNNVELTPDEVKGSGRVIPCMRCFHERHESWVEDQEGNRLPSSAKVENGQKIPIPGAQHKWKKHEHGRRLHVTADGKAEVVIEIPCDCQ